MFSQVALVIELAGLQIGVCRSDIGKGGLVHDVSGDILDRGIGNLMDEADVLVFARRDPGDASRRVISGSTMASRPRRP